MFKLLSSSESDSGKEVLNKNSKVTNETLGWLRSKSVMPLKNSRKRQKRGDDELVNDFEKILNVFIGFCEITWVLFNLVDFV